MSKETYNVCMSSSPSDMPPVVNGPAHTHHQLCKVVHQAAVCCSKLTRHPAVHVRPAKSEPNFLKKRLSHTWIMCSLIAQFAIESSQTENKHEQQQLTPDMKGILCGKYTAGPWNADVRHTAGMSEALTYP